MRFDNNDFENELNTNGGENSNTYPENNVGNENDVQNNSIINSENDVHNDSVMNGEIDVHNDSVMNGENNAYFENVNESGMYPENTENGANLREEPKDIDEVIKRHSDSLAKAAENIAGRNVDNISSDNYSNISGNESQSRDVESYDATKQLAGVNSDNLQGNFGEENGGANQTRMNSNNAANMGETGKNTAALKVQPLKEKKKSKAGRAVGLVFSAAVFGLVAGGVMVGVNRVATIYTGEIAQETKDNIVIGNPQNENGDKETSTLPITNLSNMDVSSIVDSAMPSVVSIYGKEQVVTNGWFGSQSIEQQSSGSGIIVGRTDTELLVVTNNHVIANTDSLEIEFNDGTKANASIKGGDSENDVAVVAVALSDLSEDTLSKISIADIGDSSDLKVGQRVVAIGNALGYGQSVTVGYVSALNREIQTKDGTTRNLLQTDAAINPGNSGGALINMDGQVIGINSAKYSDTDVEGMGYAIPISTVKELIEELSSKETRTVVEEDKQGYLGIQGKDVDSEMAASYDMPQGIYVYKVVEGGAAASSDLQAKDIITKFDGQTVRTMEDLKNMLVYYESGKTVDVTVQRLDESGNYTEKNVSITLGSRPVQEQ